jgi:hypothetical protein
MGITSLIKEVSGKTPTSVIGGTYCIIKILCQGSNEVDHISEGVLNSLDGQMKIL